MAAALSYTIKVWLTSIIIGTFALWSTMIIFSPAKDAPWNELPLFLLLTLVIAALISFPSSLVFFVSTYLLKSKDVTPLISKIVVGLIAVMACFVTFAMIARSDHNSIFDRGNFTLLMCYSLPIPLCVWLYRLED
ncbi:hypothetical protein [uncultured Pedobacter sp.]|uniref:hypothetical protein n=1 Tax=uncultured Pedobacter sp. TaxID=246139 RepID=UPI0025FCCB52|nr:hypothetical protein [uncultured Pedobacter sp.]